MESFFSIQGEGILQGVPTLFIRFKHCNLKPRCPYCDTDLTGEEKEISIEEINNLIKKHNPNFLCFTGGEPLLYKKEIKMICDNILDLNVKFKVETNGTIPLTNINFIHYITISPKIDIEEYRYLYNINVIKNWHKLNIFNSNMISLKFMIPVDDIELAQKTLKYIKNFLIDNRLDRFKILLSPINHNQEYLPNYKILVKLIMGYNILHNVNLVGISIQMHKLLGLK